MKKFLLVFGCFVLFLISIATLFKLQHWPGASAFFVLGFFLFLAIFLPVFFIQRMIQNKSTLNICTNVFALISTSLIFAGVLFKIMHWPGAGPMLVFGTMLFNVPTLILYIIQQFKEYDRRFSEYWRTVVSAVFASAFFIFWGLNVSRSVIFSYLIIEDVSIETNKNLNEYNAFILTQIQQRAGNNEIASNVSQSIHKQTEETSAYIDQIKKIIIDRAEFDSYAVSDHWLINAKDNYDIPTLYLGLSERCVGQELFERLNDHKVMLKQEMEQIPIENESLINELGDFGIKTELKQDILDGHKMKWNQTMFGNQTIVATLAILTSIQTEVLNAEFKCLKIVSMNLK